MEDITVTKSNHHKIQIMNRNSILLTGIVDVNSFDLSIIILETVQGNLTIKGNEMHVKRLNLEKGEVDIEGKIDSLVYTENYATRQKGESLVGRLFR